MFLNRPKILSLLCLALLPVGACSAPTRTAGTDSGAGLDQMRKSAEYIKLVAGTYASPPVTGPHVATGKSIVFVSCDQSATGCANAAAGAAEAAQSLGWKLKIIDGKSDPRAFATAVDQGVVSKADGIVTYGIDCSFIKQPLQRAQKAGVPVVNVEGLPCGNEGAESTGFTASVTYAEGDLSAWLKAFGEAQADYLVARTAGKAEVVAFTNKELQTLVIQQEAFAARLNDCVDCSLHTVDFGLADLGGRLTSAAKQALLKFPNANAVMVPFEGVLSGGVSAALTSTPGRQLVVVSAEGTTKAGGQLLRSGVVDAGIGIPTAWVGFSALDGLNRIFNGEQPVSSGIGIQLFDADHNVTAAGTYQPPFDYKKEFKRAWGTS
jgi:ribose transport system substrate-binding protein